MKNKNQDSIESGLAQTSSQTPFETASQNLSDKTHRAGRSVSNPDPDRRRHNDGKYALDGNWEARCRCGHTKGVHSAGSFAECLLYSLSDTDPQRLIEGGDQNCQCPKFKKSRKK